MDGTTQPTVVVVSEDPGLLATLTRMLDRHGDVVATADTREALALLESRQVAGAVIDGTLRNWMAVVLSRACRRHQPGGRVVIIGSPDDPSTLTGLAISDPRVEVLYRPLSEREVVECLLGAVAGARG
jgi:DNA-binding NtrC family response regulator